jgi:hypothetical protein
MTITQQILSSAMTRNKHTQWINHQMRARRRRGAMSAAVLVSRARAAPPPSTARPPPPVSSLACPRRYSTATGSELLDDASLVIHSFFSDNFCAKPVHLCVDTRLVDDRIDARAFVTAPNALTRSVLVSFLELKTAIVASPEARVGVDAMTKALGVFGDGGAPGAVAASGRASMRSTAK